MCEFFKVDHSTIILNDHRVGIISGKLFFSLFQPWIHYHIQKKFSFSSVATWVLAGSPTKWAWRRHGMAQLLPLWHSSALGCAQIRLLPAAWLASLSAGRAASQLFHCSSQLQCLPRGLSLIPFQEPVPLPSLRAGHGMEIIVIVILGTCRCPLSWMLYKYTDNASLHLKNL